MLSNLLNLFRRADPKRAAVLRQLAVDKIHFVFFVKGSDMPIGKGVTQDEIIAALDASVKNLEELTEFRPLTYQEKERETLPLFTSTERLIEFGQSLPPIKNYSDGKALTLNAIGKDRQEVLSSLSDYFDLGITVLLDARTAAETELTRADVEAALRSLR